MFGKLTQVTLDSFLIMHQRTQLAKILLLMIFVLRKSSIKSFHSCINSRQLESLDKQIEQLESPVNQIGQLELPV